jgi:YegS/Rv2252/BmrU family lipid kinase
LKRKASTLIIVNPVSAGGRTESSWARMASDLASNFGHFECAFTARRSDGTRLAREAAEAGYRLIVACGGDGTISEVANGIIQSGRDAELGILPSGTGGDFRRTLEIPIRTADAARLLRTGRGRRIDAGRVSYLNDEGKEESRYFIGVSSFGISGDVIARVKRENSPLMSAISTYPLGGKVTFAKSMLQTAFDSSSKHVLVKVDEGKERKFTVVNFCVANARFFGGGMNVAPHALVDDGLFDVVSIGDLSSFTILTHAYQLYRGTHLSIEGISNGRAKRIYARPASAGDKIHVEVDGELPGWLPATFEIVPSALRVRCR